MRRVCEVRDLSEWLYRLLLTAVASVTAASTSDAGGPGVAVASVVAVVRVAVRSVGGEWVLSWKIKRHQFADHVHWSKTLKRTTFIQGNTTEHR